MCSQRKIVSILAGIACASAWAQRNDGPSAGMVFGPKRDTSLTYECKQSAAAQLSCDFVMNAVRRQVEQDPEETVALAAASFRKSPRKPSAEECEKTRYLIDVYSGRKAARDPERFARVTQVEKRDSMRALLLEKAFCEKPTEANYLARIKDVLARRARTCSVSTEKFSRTFRVSGGTGEAAWSAESAPEGPCGIVERSRFVSETEAGSAGKRSWKYHFRRTVTKPSGEFSPGVTCGSVNEDEQVFSSKASGTYLGCEYVEFGPFEPVAR